MGPGRRGDEGNSNRRAEGLRAEYDAIAAGLPSARARGIPLRVPAESSEVPTLDVCCPAIDEGLRAYSLAFISCSPYPLASIQAGSRTSRRTRIQAHLPGHLVDLVDAGVN